MPYCPKCGKKVSEDASFCPYCGAQVKAEAAPPPTMVRPSRSEKQEKQEKQEKHEKGEKHEKREVSYVSFLIAGLALILFGALFFAFDYLKVASEIRGAAFLIVVGVVILVVAIVYMGAQAARRTPKP